MKNQELAFTSNEGDNWFIRNKSKIKENSAEISLLCNWLMPYQCHIDNILEIGSGAGNKLAQICWQLNAMGWGVEPSKKAVDFANKNYNKNCKFTVATADNLSFVNITFDLVHFGFCLYLVSRNKIDIVIEQADKLVKPGKFLSIVDFDPRSSFENDYIHFEGIKSYKTNYYKMFCDLGNYSLIIKFSFDTTIILTIILYIFFRSYYIIIRRALYGMDLVKQGLTTIQEVERVCLLEESEND